MNNTNQQPDGIQDKLLQKAEEKKKKKMKISGKSVFEVAKLIKKKTKENYTTNERK